MARTLNDVVASLPRRERMKIKARTHTLIAEEMSLRDLRKAIGKTPVSDPPQMKRSWSGDPRSSDHEHLSNGGASVLLIGDVSTGAATGTKTRHWSGAPPARRRLRSKTHKRSG